MRKKLTIAVAIYNLKDCLEKCLESLYYQTSKENVEILLINDGSTDNSEEICQKYIDRGLEAKIINKKNGGLTSVRNLSIEEAKGEYLLMIDGDDWLESDAVQIILNNIKDYDLLCFGFKWVYEKNYVLDERFFINQEYSENIVDTIFKNEINTAVWNKVFKTSILKEKNIKFPEIKGAEDYIFIYDYLNECNKVKKITNVLYNYYQRENSLSKEKNDEFYLNNLIVQEEFIKRVKKNNQDSKLFFSYILSNYIYLAREYNKKSEKKILENINQKREIIEKYLEVKKVLFLSNFKLKNKIRYLKIKRRKK